MASCSLQQQTFVPVRSVPEPTSIFRYASLSSRASLTPPSFLHAFDDQYHTLSALFLLSCAPQVLAHVLPPFLGIGSNISNNSLGPVLYSSYNGTQRIHPVSGTCAVSYSYIVLPCIQPTGVYILTLSQSSSPRPLAPVARSASMARITAIHAHRSSPFR